MSVHNGKMKTGEIVDKTKGKIKQVVGVVTGDSALRREGQLDELAGKVEGVIAAVEGAIKDVGHSIKKAVK